MDVHLSEQLMGFDRTVIHSRSCIGFIDYVPVSIPFDLERGDSRLFYLRF